MPRITRLAQRRDAGIRRQTGETVYLLTPPPAPVYSGVPLDLVGANAPPPISSCTVSGKLYATVKITEAGKITHEEGGKVVNRRITIEVSAKQASLVNAALFFRLQDGTYYQKVDEKLNDGYSTYTVVCTSYMDPLLGG